MKACTAEQMREIDRRAVSEYGMPSLLLMENAGRAVAQRLLMLLEEPACRRGIEGREIVVLCGKGNNGGDGFVAARHLHNRGFSVTCRLAGDPSDVKGDARVNLDLARRLGIPVRPFKEDVPGDLAGELDAARWVVDALLGTGFQGEPRGTVAAMIRAANLAARPTLAVDVPSGMDADTGHVSAVHVRATETITFGLPKLGLLSYPGRAAAGSLTVADICLPRPLLEDPAIRTEWITGERAAALWPPRPATTHKGDSGRLFILAGSAGLAGAAALACEGALRAGAGLVTLGIPASLHDVMAVKLTEAMTLPLPEIETRAHSPDSAGQVRERLRNGGALAAGPGFGRDPRSGELLRAVLAGCPVPVVVDADGLYLLSPAGEGTFPARCVITPHPGEMARLLGTETSEVESNRVETARGAAARFGCVVVLKGPATVVAAPDGRLAINSSGGAALATGGTGDTLTGILGACLARGLEPYEAAVGAVFLHGLAGEIAGERFGAPGAIAGDVAASVPEALRRLHTGEIPLPCRIV
jgi:ADP-dependent NAD(P)H-hydrate dehydratase / NAD(P)H-hydrate epimerase